MSSKRNQLPANSKNQDRDRTCAQTRPHPQAQHRRRNNPNPSYPSQTTYTQNHHPSSQVYNTYPEDEGMNDRYDMNYSRRMPSARISEVDSQDGYTESPSHYPMEVYDEAGEYVDSGKALVKHDRRSDSRQSDRSAASQGYSPAQGYEEYPIAPASKHPSAHRLRQPAKVNDTKSSTHREPIGKSMAPKAFKPVQNSSHFDPNPQVRDQDQDEYGDSQDAYEDSSSPYESAPAPPQGDETDDRYALKPAFQPTRSKLNQLTTFDTPSEKGFRGNPPSTIVSNNSRSSAASALGRRGRGLQADIQPLADSPTAPVKVGRHRNIANEVKPGLHVKNDFSAGFDIDSDFQDQDTSDDFLDSSPLKPTQVTSLLTPPSDRSLALGKSKVKLTKQVKTQVKTAATSDEADPLDPRNIDGLLDLIETPDVVIGPKTNLKLKMPKTVNQVVAHISTILAKKVAKEQGEVAIKSSEDWDWSRLPVLASEIKAGTEEMENLIHAAGRDRQGAIEETKRKRVELEAGNTDQYEEFRRDFREACEKMQQPAMGKRFKFGHL